MRSLLLLAPLVLTGCLIAPTKYHLDLKNVPACISIQLPAPWTFAGDGPPGFAVRLDGAGFLLRGRQGTTLSREVYRIVPGRPLAQSTETEWTAAKTVEFTRRSLHPEYAQHEAVPPSLEHQGRELRLSGQTFWRASETTRLSANGRYLSAVSYSDSYGWFRPQHRAHVDVFDLRAGRRLLSLSGEAPSLPPFGQFDEIGWLGDEFLLLPHTAAGSEMDACRVGS